MKRTISVTIDEDIYLMAREKLPNISEAVNNFLINLVSEKGSKEIKEIESELEKTKTELISLLNKKTILQIDLEKAQQKAEIETQLKLKLETEVNINCLSCKKEYNINKLRCPTCNFPNPTIPKEIIKEKDKELLENLKKMIPEGKDDKGDN